MAALPWRLKRWTGSAWADAELRRWNGSSFVTADMWFWDGSAWVLCTDRTPPTSTFNTTWESIWCGTYQQSGAPSGLSAAYQGYVTSTYGIQTSMFGWDFPVVHSALLGRVATYDTQVRFANLHTYFGSGMYAVVGTHDHVSQPGSFAYNRYNDPGSIFFLPGEAKYTSINTNSAAWFGEDGTAAGFTLYANSYDATYYGYFDTVAYYFASYEK